MVNLDDFFAVVYTGFHEVIVSTRYISLHIANKEVQDLDLFETGRAAGRRRWRSKQQPRLRVRAPAGPPRVTFPCGRGGVLWTAWPHVAAPPHHTATPHESLVASNFACARRPAPAGQPHGQAAATKPLADPAPATRPVSSERWPSAEGVVSRPAGVARP